MTGDTFLDTNVLVYLFDRDTPDRQKRAQEVVETLGAQAVVSTQVLQEFYVTVTRKLARPLSEADAEAAVRDLAHLQVIDTDRELVLEAVARSRADRMSFWDALIVESALRGGCERVLSEDLQDGRRFDGVRIENPFTTE
jgi:predicted nucleic acid-binding protein